MKYVKPAGIVWATIYFVVGAWSSFTLNSNDTWASVGLLFGLFLLPLPITIVAAWFPKGGGKALLGCVAINVIAMVAVVVGGQTLPASDIAHFIVYLTLYNIPHLLFGWGYLRAAGTSQLPNQEQTGHQSD